MALLVKSASLLDVAEVLVDTLTRVPPLQGLILEAYLQEDGNYSTIVVLIEKEDSKVSSDETL